ncbi:Gfo/Idh/MocA family protein [Qingshengfaniella alkalisoli]|uniref:Gfo/Idh/MocA family oxidoreductase n=1 Tax=Qingshengfaniella alkalisoli TaxID=2599296 RepID=A0A5B8IYK6_9RHOB|nr:Gfo/Idh/MocA family oxidoreductase [Qingshengfaniella alkalisoli]QDY71212.1 Gfo/Idh/MocA family oxidoreductase [Qingshengfaniella alkalisoli]
MTKKPVRILILGTGTMANVHAQSFAAIDGVEVVGGVDNRPDVLKAFCEKHSIPNAFGLLDDALEWGEFDAVANVTPDAVHYPTTMMILEQGKHILCEKPLSTQYGYAAEMADRAREKGVVSMVNLSYRNVPALQYAAEMIRNGTLGTVRHFEASYLQSWLTQPAWGDWRTESAWLWRLSREHGSKGVLGDVGIHIVDFATFIAGSLPAEVSCRLETFDKAEGGKIGEYTLDANDSFAMHMKLQNGAIGTISATRFASGHHNDLQLRIYGDYGGLEVKLENFKSILRGCIGAPAMLAQEWTEIDTPEVPTIYERFIAAIREERPPEPTFDRGAELQKVLDLSEISSAQDCKTLLATYD